MIISVLNRKIVACCCLLMVAGNGAAQTEDGKSNLFTKAKAFLNRSVVHGVDTNYVKTPAQPWQVSVKSRVAQTDLQMLSTIDGGELFDGEGTSTKRTLKFTNGDKLYVTGTVAEGKILAGFLDATSINGTSATFTGTYTSTNGNEFSKDPGLHVYQYSGGKYVTVSTTDGDGKATFAYYVPNMKDNTSYSHAIRFKPSGGDWKRVVLGDKAFTNKVYNVTRTEVATDPGTPGRPTFDNITSIPEPNAKGGYIFANTPETDTEFTLSGTSIGYYFRFKKAAIITLNGFSATYNAFNSGLWGFFDCDNNLTLTLKGANSITCKNKDQCIYVFGNMTLTGTSGATLTVTCRSSSTKGIQAEGTMTLTGVSVSDQTYNTADGTYTWTYRVN